MSKNTETDIKGQSKFNKRQLLNSKRYRDRRDLISVLLEDGKEYSHTEVEKLITAFLEGKVK